MQIDSLLEKRERAIYQLLLFVENRKDAPLLKDVCRHLDLTKSTLLRYIDSFNEESHATELGLLFHLEEEKVSLQKDARLSQQRILSYLFQPSIKYQIIVFLLDKEDVSLQTLSQELLISEATLNRHLASLNQLLAEFGIIIPPGIQQLQRRLPDILEDADNHLPDLFREQLGLLQCHLIHPEDERAPFYQGFVVLRPVGNGVKRFAHDADLKGGDHSINSAPK